MIIYLVILLAVISRFFPHIPNAAPVTALAIFAAVYLPKKQALVLPLAVRFISDIFLGFFAWQQMIAVYAAHLAGFFLGSWVKKSKNQRIAKWGKLIFSAALASMIFFLVTNFAFLYPQNQYAHTWSGIMLAYYNGLPFLRGTLLGDIGYTVALAAVYEAAVYFSQNRALLFRKQAAKA
jgi:Na+/H+-dicarboxylate symporter